MENIQIAGEALGWDTIIIMCLQVLLHLMDILFKKIYQLNQALFKTG